MGGRGAPAEAARGFDYTGLVRRLLQLGVLLLSVAAVLTPLVEWFDRWDPPVSPMTDTEFSVFGLILVLCLILLVSRLLAVLRKVVMSTTFFLPWRGDGLRREGSFAGAGFVIPHSSPPLRI